MAIKLLKVAAVEEMTGLSGTTLLRMEQSGTFPQRFRLRPDEPRGPIRWYLHEIEDWLTKLSGDQLRASRARRELQEDE